MSEGEVLRLRAEVSDLRALVAALERRVSALEGAEGFEVVEEAPRAFNSQGPSSRTALAASPTVASAAELEPRDPVRAAAAADVGRFLARACAGENRGASGRDRIQLASYIVLAGFDGIVFEEARVFSKFGPVKSLCKRRPDAGRSIFIGLPSQWEVSIALRTAGYSWPARGVDAIDY
eukprot:s2154_g5.t1